MDMETIYIIEVNYRGRSENMFDTYPHRTYEGAERHMQEIVAEFKEEHAGRDPEEEAVGGGSAFIEYGDVWNDMLTAEIHKSVIGE